MVKAKTRFSGRFVGWLLGGIFKKRGGPALRTLSCARTYTPPLTALHLSPLSFPTGLQLGDSFETEPLCVDADANIACLRAINTKGNDDCLKI